MGNRGLLHEILIANSQASSPNMLVMKFKLMPLKQLHAKSFY